MAMQARDIVPKKRYTVVEFVKMPEYHERFELIYGEVVAKSVPKYTHGRIVKMLIKLYLRFDPDEVLGEFIPEVSFQGGPDYAPVPDCSYWVAARKPTPQSTIAEPPDIAIEVQSPGQSLVSLTTKAQDYLHAGVKLVWVIQPSKQLVHVYQSGVKVVVAGINDALSAQNIIPGFQIKVGDLLS